MEPGFFQISLKVFLREGDHLLVLRDRVAQCGDLPGGRLTRDEFYGDWEVSLQREIREELGAEVRYRLSPVPLFVFPHRILSAGTDALGIAYRADYEGGRIRLSDEHDHFAWVPLATYDPAGFFPEHMAAAVHRFQRAFA